jgi:hypothetical protein
MKSKIKRKGFSPLSLDAVNFLLSAPIPDEAAILAAHYAHGGPHMTNDDGRKPEGRYRHGGSPIPQCRHLLDARASGISLFFSVA